MPTPPSRTPAERFAAIFFALTAAVVNMRAGDRLSQLLVNLIVDKIRNLKQGFARLAARIAAGTYKPRRFAHHRAPAARKPRADSKLSRKFGWLQPMVQDANSYRSQFADLLQDPEMAALMAAAPASMARLLRPLCWMLRITPPEVLALPPRPRPVREKPPPKPRAELHPRWPHDPRRRDRLGHYIGPPPDFASIRHFYGSPRQKTR